MEDPPGWYYSGGNRYESIEPGSIIIAKTQGVVRLKRRLVIVFPREEWVDELELATGKGTF